MRTDQIAGIFTSVIALSMVSVAIIYGDKTAKVAGSIGNGFSKIIRAATLR